MDRDAKAPWEVRKLSTLMEQLAKCWGLSPTCQASSWSSSKTVSKPTKIYGDEYDHSVLLARRFG